MESSSLDELEEMLFSYKLKSFAKLMVILASYGLAFMSAVQLGIWLSKELVSDVVDNRTVTEWALVTYNQGDYKDPYIVSIFIDILLLIGFGLQHSLMSRRVLQETTLWNLLHYTYQIDKPIYLAFTGLALQGLMHFWRPIPLLLWIVPYLTGYTSKLFCLVAQVLSWALLYGTSLMLDLPDMIGMNQVAISSPTVTAKSANLQMLHFKQRHMGLVPFLVILFLFPQMSLDRFLLALGTIYYMNRAWKSSTCYEYTKNMRNSKKFVIDTDTKTD